MQLTDTLMVLTLHWKSFCDIKYCLVFHISLFWAQPLCVNLAHSRPYKTRQNPLFLSDINIRSMLKDMKKKTISGHHNIYFPSDVITTSMPKVRQDNITTLSTLINDNSLRLASVFFSVGSNSWTTWGK